MSPALLAHVQTGRSMAWRKRPCGAHHDRLTGPGSFAYEQHTRMVDLPFHGSLR